LPGLSRRNQEIAADFFRFTQQRLYVQPTKLATSLFAGCNSRLAVQIRTGKIINFSRKLMAIAFETVSKMTAMSGSYAIGFSRAHQRHGVGVGSDEQKH
jgi:hypothetical protein